MARTSEELEELRRQRNITRSEFMTDKEMTEIDETIKKLNMNQGYMSTYYEKWTEQEETYRNDQPKETGKPNTRVAIVHSIIEGQVSSLVDKNIAVMCKGQGYSDNSFARWAQVGLDWTFRQNKIKKVLAVHERRRSIYGIGWLKLFFDADEINGFGLSKITCPPLNKVYIDTKIKDPLRYQEAEYIAETIRLSKTQFEEIYGYEKASAILYGGNFFEDTNTFKEDYTDDDQDAATLIQFWSKYKGKLRLREFSGCGLLLYDSHKPGDRETNQKDSEYEHKSYYKFVNNKYPYFLTDLYPEEGKLIGFGECQLLKPLQDLLNELYDKIRICARPNLILFDTDSEVDLDDFDENSYEPRPVVGSPSDVVDSVQWGTINDSWWRLLLQIHEEIQRVARTSYMNLGQNSSADTATEAAIQQQEGANAIDHKKLMLQDTLCDLAKYALGLMMEKYTEARAFRIDENKEDYEWIDFRQLANVPAMKPATKEFIDSFKANNPEIEPPEWEVLNDSKGNPITKNIDLDVEINIGAGLPTNKAFIYQMAEKLSQLIVEGKNVVSWKEIRGFIKDFIGMPLDDDDEIMQQQAMQGLPQGINDSAYSQGLTIQGNPQTQQLDTIRGGNVV